MLGNVKPHLPRLADEAKNKYNTYYCGLCKTLGRQNGLFSRFMLNYDMVFVAMIYDELHTEQQQVKHTGCFANPFRKKDILQPTAGTAYAADVLMLLVYFKLVDNFRDEGIIKKIGCGIIYPYFYLKFRSAAKRQPRLAEVFKAESHNQFKAEKESKDIDSLAMPTANMVRAIMADCGGKEHRRTLGRMGFFLGRVIYLLDALKDRAEDEKGGKFNIFNIGGYTEESAKAECFMSLGEMARRYAELEMENIKEITDNIIYMSLARQIKFSGRDDKGKENYGQ